VTFSGPSGERLGPWDTTIEAEFAAGGWQVEEGARLVAFLIQWKLSESSLPKAMIALAHSMARESFWTSEDVALMESWVEVSAGGMQ
jgi:hypothetical protein